MPTIPSTSRSGSGPRSARSRVARPPARSQCGQAGLVDLLGEEQRLDGDAAAGQPGTGPERVTTVVAGADEQQHAAAVRTCPGGRAPPRRDRPRRAASARRRAAAPSRRPPHGVRPRRGGRAASLRTPGPRRPRRCRRRGRARRARGPRRVPRAWAATVPRISKRGRPVSSETISASCQAIPTGAPSALAMASLAANRAASEAGGRDASASVNSRPRRLGVRSRDCTKRSMSTTSMPTPMTGMPTRP